jgi:glycosyltransferase involved in cell wall biosynthesis
MNFDMRLLLLTDSVGGVWVYSLELAHALRPLGVETVLGVMGPSPRPIQLEQAREFRLIDTGLPLDWLGTDPDELRRAGDAIAKLAARERVDVVQTSSAALLAHSSFDRPCVAVQHSCTASWWAAVKRTPLPAEFEWRRELVNQGLQAADAVVAPSHAFAAETERLYNVRTPVVPVHNGRRTDPVPHGEQADFVLIAGRLWDDGKNIATLDAAAARLKVPFEAAGADCGPNGASARFEHLHLLGELSSARLAALRGARPIFASAALYEPFGLSVLEAAQAGCALVLSDIPTHRELWSGAAIFVPPQDDRLFANAIADLLNDSDERSQLGQLAKGRAGHFAPERMASRMAAIYASLTQPSAAEAPREMAGAA